MNLGNRIDKLEKQTGIDKPDRPWIVVVCEDIKNPSEAELEEAKAEYKAKHPDWQERDYNVIYTKSTETKELVERVIAGEGPNNDTRTKN